MRVFHDPFFFDQRGLQRKETIIAQMRLYSQVSRENQEANWETCRDLAVKVKALCLGCRSVTLYPVSRLLDGLMYT